MLARVFVWSAFVFVMTSFSMATDRYFGDITEVSPSKKYKVEAKSPQNQKGKFQPFQSNFVYQCIDTQSGHPVWTRQQAMGEPFRFGKDSLETIPRPIEPSPVSIIVGDSGWTAIRTSAETLIFVDPLGKDQGLIDILEDGITEEENEKYVHFTTAGPHWSGYSEWYFMNVQNQLVFVVRPWWGRHIYVDPTSGKTPEIAGMDEAATEYETNFVLATLKRGELQNENADWPMLHAAYIAGQMNITEAIPLLREVENSNYVGSYTTGGLGSSEVIEDEVDPHTYRTFAMRQVVQLSLRRLGETPEPYAVHEFYLSHGDESNPFLLPMLKTPRHQLVPQIKVGMGAKEVLLLAGPPDFVGNDTWSYDLDSAEPYSLTLTWDGRKIVSIERVVTPLWKSGTSRDESIVY